MTSTPDFYSALTMADAYMQARNYRRAEEVLRSALVHDPHNARLLSELARAQHASGDIDAAAQSARDALALTPTDAYPMRIYASILVDLDCREEGLSWARWAVDTDPFDHSTHYEYARLLVIAGEAAAALPVAIEALRLVPADADAHVLLGVVLGKLGRSAESTAEFEEALRLEPEHAQALANIAAYEANGWNLRGAFEGFNAAARLDPHIGDEVRRNITATVRRWLGWMTFGAWITFAQLVRIQEDADANSKRSVALFGCLVMVGTFGWLVWSLPRNLWGPLLRQRGFRSLKIYLGLGVVVLGVLGAFTLGAPVNFWVLVGTLLITFVVYWVAPRFDRD